MSFSFPITYTVIATTCAGPYYDVDTPHPVSACPDGKVKDGALCYPKCKDGYDGVADRCWEICRSGYTNMGLTCFKGVHIYGNKCSGNCKKGYKNDGCTCRFPGHSYGKNSYSRGAGTHLVCQKDQYYDGLGYCYNQCKEGSTRSDCKQIC